MNLKKLFDLQRQLDERIEQEHPRHPREDRLEKKILALMVEIGELANEWRGFKFWSNNQEPRTEVKIPCLSCGGYGEGYFVGHTWTGKKEKCIHCNGTGIEKLKNPLLEEHVDCLHFVLSIGLDILDDLEIYPEPIAYDDIIEQFNRTFEAVSYFYTVVKREHETQELVDEYKSILSLMFGLGGKLGFTWQQIEEVYIQKNQENFKRQEEGY